jgi:hypothetical protein
MSRAALFPGGYSRYIFPANIRSQFGNLTNIRKGLLFWSDNSDGECHQRGFFHLVFGIGGRDEALLAVCEVVMRLGFFGEACF